ncbi:aldo/keto reductase [Engelhardtia mirabilis]|uniref:General stress protein 69 n=1 Tax=Engelhardtia mirabilis TaxID=2528011 RepID=A0A518BLZ6_9BACT|nr:General stress protein 69 [Planctomycetes bacterium Pla133]QDV02335.1 General stress protein 69 [Planctomycetes bacterium Pla86]
MKKRILGSTDLEVPVITVGAWAIGGWQWGDADDAESLAALRAAYDAGMTAVDTAPIYGFGRSERVVAQSLVGRDDVVVMTKCGLVWDDPAERGQLAFEGAGEGGKRVKVYKNSRPDSVKRECEQSLKRLGVDHIHLFQVHWNDPTTPVAETMGALAELRDAGKIGAIGVSNYWPAVLDQAQAALAAKGVPLASNQPRYNLVHRDAEREVLPWCRERGVGVLAYSPLEQGLLTGKAREDREFPPGDQRAGRASFRPENRAAINGVLDDVVAPIAERHDATLAQTCLAWTIAQPGITTVLAGLRKAAQADENARAGALELGDDELDAIDRAFAALDLDLRE